MSIYKVVLEQDREGVNRYYVYTIAGDPIAGPFNTQEEAFGMKDELEKGEALKEKDVPKKQDEALPR